MTSPPLAPLKSNPGDELSESAPPLQTCAVGGGGVSHLDAFSAAAAHGDCGAEMSAVGTNAHAVGANVRRLSTAAGAATPAARLGDVALVCVRGDGVQGGETREGETDRSRG